MKKILITISIIFIFLIININPASAIQANYINHIDIVINIQENGDAHISEKWDINVNNGTEIYKVMNNLGGSQIENFLVTDDKNAKYQYMDIWDIGRSKAYKSYKCGVIQEGDHYELCFGIGNYGQRNYTLTYIITDFVKQFSDNQGFNTNILSDFTIPVNSFTIYITSPYGLTDDTLDIYGFGFKGTMNYDNDQIIITSSESLELGHKVQLISQFSNADFKDIKQESQSMKSIIRKMKANSRFNESEYYNDNTYHSFLLKTDYSLIYLLIFITILGLIGITGLISYVNYKNKLKEYTFKDHKDINNNDIHSVKQIPAHLSLFEVYYLSNLCELITPEQQYNLIAAMILEWLNKNRVQLKINNDNEFEISFNELPFDTELEKELFNYLKEAAGTNLLLEKDEFDRWYEENYEKIEEWLEDVYKYVEELYMTKHLVNSEEVSGKWLFKYVSEQHNVYDNSLKKEIIHIIGLKKYLEEDFILETKQSKHLWNQYLVYINLFGIHEEVYNQLEKHELLKDMTEIRFSNTKIINILANTK